MPAGLAISNGSISSPPSPFPYALMRSARCQRRADVDRLDVVLDRLPALHSIGDGLLDTVAHNGRVDRILGERNQILLLSLAAEPVGKQVTPPTDIENSPHPFREADDVH